MMAEMEFSMDDAKRFVSEFSGGWQMRMNLGKVLLSNPDLLLLDEPTNHIDLETIEWLEIFLKQSKKELSKLLEEIKQLNLQLIAYIYSKRMEKQILGIR